MKAYLVLIADQARARLFIATNPTAALTEIQDWANPQARLKEQDLVSDASGGNPHDVGHHGKVHAHFADEFAKGVCRALSIAVKEHKPERILVAAPPHFLGILRKHMDTETQCKITMELGKDLTMLTPDKIRSHLSEWDQ